MKVEEDGGNISKQDLLTRICDSWSEISRSTTKEKTLCLFLMQPTFPFTRSCEDIYFQSMHIIVGVESTLWMSNSKREVVQIAIFAI